MARSVKRPRAEPQAFHQFGVRGRKTGVVLQDRGERDEHGMQPLDSIFSPLDGRPTPGTAGSEESGSDMEIASSDGPGPQTVLKNRKSIANPIPRSRSPMKTNLNSPAKKNPHLEHLSSPSRNGLDDRDVTVTRKLDFTAKSDRPKLQSTKAMSNGASRPSRPSLQSLDEHVEEEEREDEDNSMFVSPQNPTISELVNESMEWAAAMESDNFTGTPLNQGQTDSATRARRDGILNGKPNPSPAHAPSPFKSPSPQSIRKQQPDQSIFGARKRSSADISDGDLSDREQDSRGDKRPRTSIPPLARPLNTTSRGATVPMASRPKSPVSKTESSLPLKRGRGRPRKVPRLPKQADDTDEGDESIMEIQRAPPMPRSRGLVSFRNDGASLTQSRTSGRPSVPPTDYWREEKLEYDAEQDVKMVIRLPSEAPPSSRAPGSKTRTKAKTQVNQAVEEDEELEEWEMDEGVMTGDIVVWEPHHEQKPPGDDDEVRIEEQRLAISADAIQTKATSDASFRFAKTLTSPFMGAGVVDLPPEAEKRPKNSRKMHMVFFVHYGKVLVTINGVSFRISAGGTWFVPRGNFYSIMNDYQVPARIFFAQACEV